MASNTAVDEAIARAQRRREIPTHSRGTSVLIATAYPSLIRPEIFFQLITYVAGLLMAVGFVQKTANANQDVGSSLIIASFSMLYAVGVIYLILGALHKWWLRFRSLGTWSDFHWLTDRFLLICYVVRIWLAFGVAIIGSIGLARIQSAGQLYDWSIALGVIWSAVEIINLIIIIRYITPDASIGVTSHCRKYWVDILYSIIALGRLTAGGFAIAALAIGGTEQVAGEFGVDRSGLSSFALVLGLASAVAGPVVLYAAHYLATRINTQAGILYEENKHDFALAINGFISFGSIIAVDLLAISTLHINGVAPSIAQSISVVILIIVGLNGSYMFTLWVSSLRAGQTEQLTDFYFNFAQNFVGFLTAIVVFAVNAPDIQKTDVSAEALFGAFAVILLTAQAELFSLANIAKDLADIPSGDAEKTRRRIAIANLLASLVKLIANIFLIAVAFLLLTELLQVLDPATARPSIDTINNAIKIDSKDTGTIRGLYISGAISLGIGAMISSILQLKSAADAFIRETQNTP